MQQVLFGKMIKSDLSIHIQSTELLAKFQTNMTINKVLHLKVFQ